MRALQRLIVLVFLFGFVASCDAAVPAADAILAKARTDAAAGHKNIFLLFDASW